MRVDSRRPRWTKAVRHLRESDPVMAAIVEEVGPCKLAVRPPHDPFMALAECIVYQQLTGKAARTIFDRLTALFPGREFPAPQEVLRTPVERLRSAGLSGAKTRALLDLAERVRARSLPLGELEEMDDEAVIDALTQVRGIGRWSAEMYLIFRLGRPDVLPAGDLGVKKGVQKAYGTAELPRPAELEEIAAPWRPYRSVAAWYFWARG